MIEATNGGHAHTNSAAGSGIPGPGSDLTVGITADRRWRQQAALFARRGIRALHGPTIRTVDLVDSPALRQATVSLIEQAPEWLVVVTAPGLGLWLDAARTWGREEALLQSLGRSRVVARGAKAVSAVRKAGLEVTWRAPEETMAEVVGHLVGEGVAGARVAVQVQAVQPVQPVRPARDEPAWSVTGAWGAPPACLPDPGPAPPAGAGPDAWVAELARAGAQVVAVPIYRWAWPDDTGPARRLISAALTGELQAVTFTSQLAVHHLFRIAEATGKGAALRGCLSGPVLAACVGRQCAEAAAQEGLSGVVWPEPPRLPALVRQVADRLSDRS